MPRRSRLVALMAAFSALSSSAAEMAFYFALSFVPFLALTTVVALSWLPPEVGEPLAGAVIGVFPSEASLDADAITRWVGSVRTSGWLAAGLVLASWSSFHFMVAAVRTLASLGHSDPWDLWHRARTVLSAIVLMLLWMLAILATSFVLLAAPGLHETLSAQGWLAGRGVTVAQLVHALAAVVLFLAIALTYRMIPGLAARGARPWLMAAVATGGWVAVAELARTVLPVLWAGRSLYGALGSFVLFLFWCWANAWVLLACGLLAGRRARARG